MLSHEIFIAILIIKLKYPNVRNRVNLPIETEILKTFLDNRCLRPGKIRLPLILTDVFPGI